MGRILAQPIDEGALMEACYETCDCEKFYLNRNLTRCEDCSRIDALRRTDRRAEHQTVAPKKQER
jgi:hypothetical protein